MIVEIIDQRIERVTPAEGMVLTKWKEGDPLASYAGSLQLDGPVGFDHSQYREITREEHEALEAAGEGDAV